MKPLKVEIVEGAVKVTDYVVFRRTKNLVWIWFGLDQKYVEIGGTWSANGPNKKYEYVGFSVCAVGDNGVVNENGTEISVRTEEPGWRVFCRDGKDCVEAILVKEPKRHYTNSGKIKVVTKKARM